jgi:hypothetical protein
MERKTALLFWCKYAAAAACVLLISFLVSCKSCRQNETGGVSPGRAAPTGPQFELAENVSVRGGHSYAHVTYKPEVKMVEEAQADASLQDISDDGHVFVFQNAPPQVQALKSGDILFIKNQLVRKVLVAKTDGGQTVLVTDRATITDVVKDGEIHIETPLSFHGAKRTSEIRPPAPSFLDAFCEPAYAQTSLDRAESKGTQDAAKNAAKSVIGMLFDDWKVVQYSYTPGDNELDGTLQLAKSKGGLEAGVYMTGYVTNFDFFTHINMVQGAGSKVLAGIKGMTGRFQFDWEIGKGSAGVWATEDRIKLPGAISIPLAPLLGGLPLTLEVSEALLIRPVLTGGNEMSQGGFNVTWTGDGGFSFQRGSSGNTPNPSPSGGTSSTPNPSGTPGPSLGGKLPSPGGSAGTAPNPGGNPGQSSGGNAPSPGSAGNIPIPSGLPGQSIGGNLPSPASGPGNAANTPNGGGNFGTSSTIELNYAITRDTNISPVAPNAMVISYCAPRIELRFDVFGKYKSTLKKAASNFDKVEKAALSLLPEDWQKALTTASKVLSSDADVYVQIITTEGTTHSANQTLAPCSKQEIKVTGQWGGELNLFGLTKGATHTEDFFTKTWTRYTPASDFCKGV